MAGSLSEKWKVTKKDFIIILCVFAITGCTTAYLSKLSVGWVGFNKETHWALKLLLRIGVLVFGYQIILLSVAFLLGQFDFFWRYEKRLLTRLKIIRKRGDDSRQVNQE